MNESDSIVNGDFQIVETGNLNQTPPNCFIVAKKIEKKTARIAGLLYLAVLFCGTQLDLEEKGGK